MAHCTGPSCSVLIIQAICSCDLCYWTTYAPHAVAVAALLALFVSFRGPKTTAMVCQQTALGGVICGGSVFFAGELVFIVSQPIPIAINQQI